MCINKILLIGKKFNLNILIFETSEKKKKKQIKVKDFYKR